MIKSLGFNTNRNQDFNSAFSYPSTTKGSASTFSKHFTPNNATPSVIIQMPEQPRNAPSLTQVTNH
jgi:hypothetical protein